MRQHQSHVHQLWEERPLWKMKQNTHTYTRDIFSVRSHAWQCDWHWMVWFLLLSGVGIWNLSAIFWQKQNKTKQRNNKRGGSERDYQLCKIQTYRITKLTQSESARKSPPWTPQYTVCFNPAAMADVLFKDFQKWTIKTVKLEVTNSIKFQLNKDQ